MRLSTIRTAALCTLMLGGMAVTGCNTKTEAEMKRDRAATLENSASMLERGQKMKDDGAAMEARGKSKNDGGDKVEGERMINEGQLMQRNGQATIEQARKMGQ